MVEPGFALAVVADEPDNRVLEAAVEARTDAVVTGDTGLLTLGAYDGIPIMSATRFLEWRGSAEHWPSLFASGHRGAPARPPRS